MKTRIKEIRKAKGITQKELARRLGITAGALSQIEREDNNIKGDTLLKIARALDCSMYDLLGNNLDAYIDDEIYRIENETIQKINTEYMRKLSIPALQLNDLGRKLLLDNAESMAKNEELTK